MAQALQYARAMRRWIVLGALAIAGEARADRALVAELHAGAGVVIVDDGPALRAGANATDMITTPLDAGVVIALEPPAPETSIVWAPEVAFVAVGPDRSLLGGVRADFRWLDALSPRTDMWLAGRAGASTACDDTMTGAEYGSTFGTEQMRAGVYVAAYRCRRSSTVSMERVPVLDTQIGFVLEINAR